MNNKNPQEGSSNNEIENCRRYSLGLPQLLSGGMSENWLMKELGDFHWELISKSLRVKSGEIADGNGKRLNASFVRLKWSSDHSLFSFKENDEITLNGNLSLYGNKMFFSDQEIQCNDKIISASLISVFSSRESSDNDSLVQGIPAGTKTAKVHRHKKLPVLAKEYIAAKSFFAAANRDYSEDLKINFYETLFSLKSESIYKHTYRIDPYDDINGVGLLYFASYSKISDKCEFFYFQENVVGSNSKQNWAECTSCIARDVLYFGNANAGEELIYTLDEWHYFDQDKIKLVSSLYRKKDGVLISKILTVKQLLYSSPKENINQGEPYKKEEQLNRKESSELSITSEGIIQSEKPSVTIRYLSEVIIEFLISMLGGESMDENTDLRKLGVESIVYISLSEYLNENLNIDSNPSKFFGLYSVKEIVDYLTQANDIVIKEKEVLESNSSFKLQKGSSCNVSEKFLPDIPISDDIAIIGISFRVPGASNKEELWDNLINGRSSISKTPAERWKWPEWIQLEGIHKGINYGGYVNDIDKFDPLFFGISPREAELMDPQQRILLELTWELFESSGYKPSLFKGTQTGVFIGVSGSDYELTLRKNHRKDTATATGTAIALLANRISYFYGLEGPSLSIDTACSSSLVAINEAIKAIKSNQCSTAVVGGVHIMCDPSRSIAYRQSNMLSEDGKCHTFDKAANGYVRGEGAITMLLKPASEAIKCNDRIWGIIKGSSVNHGGESGGLTVPNPHQQQRLIEDAYKDARIPVETVGYIEAHGTGTSLGDPIEVSALSAAFKNLSKSHDKRLAQWCGIGSIKTNIGHLEAVSGMAGLLKLLLSFQNKCLPSTQNFATLNPKIELKDSPFYVLEKSTKWDRFDSCIPLRAGVSSFGIGGANAHVVIEEYETLNNNDQFSDGPFVFVLSAKNGERLKVYARSVVDYLNSRPELNPLQLSFSLQVSKESMEERLAIVSPDVESFKSALIKFINDIQAENLFCGNSKTEKKVIAGYNQEVKIFEITKDLNQLARLWALGANINWDILYENKRISKIDLPSYPFVRQTCWVEIKEHENLSNPNVIHPLLHTNDSDLREQKYRSIFSGGESFFDDHIINGQKILPGVAYLELALKAGSISSRQRVTKIRDVFWVSPITINNNQADVQINIYPFEDYLGYKVSAAEDGELKLKSQGRIFTNSEEKPVKYNLDSIRNGLSEVLDKQFCYDLFKKTGYNYGKSFQGIQEVLYSDTVALSSISLERNSAFALSPGLLDSAVQSCLIFQFANRFPALYVPYSVKEVIIYNMPSEKVLCYVTRAINTGAKDTINSYNIELLGEDGGVLISFKEFTFLPVGETVTKTSAFDKEDKSGVYLFANEWVPSSIPERKSVINEKLLLLAGGSEELSERLRERLEIDVEFIKAESPEEYFFNVFKNIQEKAQSSSSQNIILLCENGAYHEFGFVSGLFKSAHLENPKLNGKVLGVERLSIKDVDSLVNILEAEFDNTDPEVRIRKNDREVRSLITQLEDNYDEIRIKEEGVYLVTGGAGGLGRVFADYINKKYKARVILCGRSIQTKEIASILKDLNEAEYFSVDLGKRNEVENLINNILAKYSRIDGIIHCAGLVKDNVISRKQQSEIYEVFTPKILGTRLLDEVTKDLPLDFMIYFSSMSSITGNIGQCDYASANAFLDNYATYRNELCLNGKRSGKTLSINWPLWKDGGMKVDENVENRLNNQWGMETLTLNAGILAFEQALKVSVNQVIIGYGSEKKVSSKILATARKEQAKEHVSYQDSNLESKVSNKLVSMVAGLTKLEVSLINIDEELGDYGFDSILFTQLSNDLNDYYNLDLMPTAFYNYPTIAALSHHLVEEYHSLLIKQHQNISLAEPEGHNTANRFKNELMEDVVEFLKPNEVSFDMNEKEAPQEEGIAVIGISARFPGSPDLNTFWENIRDNKDLITEVPESRWNWKDYFGNPYLEKGKTKAKWGGFIEDIDKFDPLFFGISPQEAELMDPQQRIVIESVFHALEDSGISPDSIKGSNAGVFIGVSTADYALLLSKQKGFTGEAQYATGSFYSILANRISFLLDLHGPSQPIDTACSSSLVSIHRACECLRNSRSDLAIVGGVNAILAPDVTLSFTQAGMLSEDGRCKTFDKDANGYVRSEGVGVVILKKLSKAIADGDQIYGIIRGSAENHGGKANTLTSPNPNAQKDVIVSAFRSAKMDPRRVGYIEAHGTGTPLGDPIEMEGLKLAFKELYKGQNLSFPDVPSCGIGSVKTNIGHLEAAAGMAGLMKVLCAIRNKQIPGNVHLNSQNEFIKLEGSPFYLQRETSEWKSQNNTPRVAGISSFGFGGANAHIVVEEYIPQKPEGAFKTDQPAIVVLSARNHERLVALAGRLKAFLEKNDEVGLYDLAYTLQVGRKAMEERLAFVVQSKQELKEYLDSFIQNKEVGYLTGNVRKGELGFLLEGEAGEAYIRTAVAKKQSKALAGIWVKGINLDWTLLYSDGKYPRKISLPVYPFARERYWINIQNTDVPEHNSARTKEESFEQNDGNNEQLGGKDSVSAFIKSQISRLIHMDEHLLEDDEFISNYGIGSIQINHLASAINANYNCEIRPLEIQSCLTITEIVDFVFSETGDIDFHKPKAVVHTEKSKTEDSRQSINIGKYEDDRDIAIIGVDIEVDGAASLSEIQELLEKDSYKVSSFPKDRWDLLPAHYTNGLNRTDFKGKFLENILGFDHKLFQISVREAMMMDPQQRMLLQSVWRAIENAGYKKGTFSQRKTSVYVAINGVDYADIVKYDPHIDEFSGRGVKRYISANRISNFFGLIGVSETIDTACSSFFVGIQKAMEAIRSGACDQAIVCGVQANLLPFTFREQLAQGILTTGERTLPFDINAQGYIRAEGVGTVILKRKSLSRIDKDYVYAWLKGAGVAYGGRTLNLTSPNISSHKQAFNLALDDAKVGIDNFNAIELHGTGMPLGDESEIKAITEVFKEKGRSKKEQCIIGAAKSIFGHLEAGSGALALIKSIISLKNGKVHGIQGIKKVNPFYSSEYLSISHEDQNFNSSGVAPALVGLHSYGIGGVSSFLILQNTDNETSFEIEGEVKNIFVLSAQSDTVLTDYVKIILSFLEQNLSNPSFSFSHFLASSQVNREVMKTRIAVISHAIPDLIDKLKNFLNKKSAPGILYSDHNDLSEPSNADLDLNAIAQEWVGTGNYDWGIKTLSKHPYPHYPMDRRKSFWISKKENGETHKPVKIDVKSNPIKENEFLMLDN